MEPKTSVWDSTLAEFDEQIAQTNGITGAVSVAAISGALAIHVLRMVLEVAAKRKGSEADRPRIQELLDAAREEWARLQRFADADRAAYAHYVDAVRLPRSNEEERGQRTRAMRTALRSATETPLGAARAAVAAIDLCLEAAPFARGEIMADVGGAACLLSGAVHCMLLSVDANLKGVEDEKFAAEVGVERRALEEHAKQRTQMVRQRLAL